MDDRRKKNPAPVPIDSVIGRVLESCRSFSDQGMTGVFEVWDRAVGEVIAENARPAAFKGSILIVHVSSSSWIQHLRFMKEDLIARVNAHLEGPGIEEIKFRIGPL